MLRRFGLLALAAVLGGCISVSGNMDADMPDSFYERGEHVAAVDGAIRVSKVVKVLFNDDFSGPSDKWEITNYNDNIKFEYGERLGTRGLLLLKAKTKDYDTAFELKSRAFEVSGGSDFVFTVSARGSLAMKFASPYKDLYHNQIEWLDKDGAVTGVFPYKFSVKNSSVTVNKFSGKVPEAAVKAVIRMGADNPNVTDVNYLNLVGVSFESEDKNSLLWPTGSFVSRPFLVPEGGKIIWEGETPGNTSISVQLSVAPDVNGEPGVWTPFAGPDWDPEKAYLKSGTKLSIFPEKHPWLKYKVSLRTDGALTPVLKQIRIGENRDLNWAGADVEAPAVTKISSSVTNDPHASIIFSVTDKTMVDWRTLECKIDGKDVTTKLNRIGNQVTYVPDKPWEAVKTDFTDIAAWERSNHQNRLEFKPLPEEGNALRVTREDIDADTSFKLISPVMPVKPGEKYGLDLEVRHNLSLPGSNKGGKHSQVRVQWIDAKGANLGGEVLCYLGKAEGWTMKKFDMVSHKGAAAAKVIIGFDVPNIHSKQYFDVRNAAWRGAVGNALVSEPNYHSITFKVSDVAGNGVSRDFFLLIGEKPERNIVTIRNDGFVLVDGKPFFPIGLYAVWKKPFNNNSFDEAFQGLKKGGFNLAHTYSSTRGKEFREFMDAADRNGIKLFIASNSGANCSDSELFLQDVIREYTHPALLAWYLADDTASHIDPQALKDLHSAIKDIDSSHITVQADGIGRTETSRYRAFVNSTDGFMPEIYPIHKERAGVPQVIRDMKRVQEDLAASGNPVKTIWPIIQYFDGWGWDRFPTFDELRAMSYLALIHGGHGITWYTYGGWGNNHGVTETPETWKNICTVATELKALQEVFLEPASGITPAVKVIDGPAKDKLDYDSISVLHKKLGDKQYLICANSSDETIYAEFDALGAEQVNVWFENRKVNVSKGSFNDTFAPYAVHVYELGKMFE